MNFFKNNVFAKLIRNEIEIKPLSILELILLAILFFVLQLLLGIPVVILLMVFGFDDNFVVTSLINTLLLVISLWIIIKILSRKVLSDTQTVYKFKITKRKILLAIGLGLAYVLISTSTIHNFINELPVPAEIEAAFEELLSQNILFVIYSIVIEAAILEEFICRGLILNGLLNKYSPKTAIIISALVFGIIHANIPQFINATIVALILGLVYYKTKSLILCIIIHAANNGFVMLIPEVDNLFIKIPMYIVFFIIGVIIFKRCFNGLGLKHALKELFPKKETIA